MENKWAKPLAYVSKPAAPAPPPRESPKQKLPDDDEHVVLYWPTYKPHVPLESERRLLNILIRWKTTEKGMLKDQPSFRVEEVKNKCRDVRMELIQGCSLRRHHLKLLHPFKSMEDLRLGESEDINAAATIFEEVVEAYLKSYGASFLTEQEQKEAFYKTKQEGDRMPPTPDFVFDPPVRLSVSHPSPWNGRLIYWLDAKMFYGASTIPHDTKNAVGGIRYRTKKYVSTFGPGALVFSYGCGDKLAHQLTEWNVVALDASPLDLTRVEQHQRGWCANAAGEILP